MRDGFVLGDGVAVKLQCGHPNVEPGERCPLCGKVLLPAPELASSTSEVLEMLKEKERERL